MRNVSERQDRLLKRIRTRVPDLVLRWSSMRGVASLIEGTLLPWKKVKRANNIIITFLREYGTLVGPPGILKAHYVTEVKQSKVTSTYRVKAYQVFSCLILHAGQKKL